MLRREIARRSIDPRGLYTNNCTESSGSRTRWCRENARRRVLEGLISNCTPTHAQARPAAPDGCSDMQELPCSTLAQRSHALRARKVKVEQSNSRAGPAGGGPLLSGLSLSARF